MQSIIWHRIKCSYVQGFAAVIPDNIINSLQESSLIDYIGLSYSEGEHEPQTDLCSIEPDGIATIQ